MNQVKRPPLLDLSPHNSYSSRDKQIQSITGFAVTVLIQELDVERIFLACLLWLVLLILLVVFKGLWFSRAFKNASSNVLSFALTAFNTFVS